MISPETTILFDKATKYTLFRTTHDTIHATLQGNIHNGSTKDNVCHHIELLPQSQYEAVFC